MDSPQCRVVAIPLLKIQACFLQLWKESKSEIKRQGNSTTETSDSEKAK